MVGRQSPLFSQEYANNAKIIAISKLSGFKNNKSTQNNFDPIVTKPNLTQKPHAFRQQYSAIFKAIY